MQKSGILKPIKLLFLHGLEGEMLKLKQRYLEKHFQQCITPYMKISRWNILQENSFPRCLIRNKFNLQDAGKECVEKCMKLQINQLNENKHDALVGISWGGGIGMLLLSQGHWNGPTILMAPAITRFLEVVGERDYKVQDIFDNINRQKLGNKLLIIHGDKDFTIPYQKSVEIVNNIKGSQLITIPNGNHYLNNIHKPPHELKDIIYNHYLKTKKNTDPQL